jgi:diadenosine tetraphosphate (Ap4A) HIT family hydrolase
LSTCDFCDEFSDGRKNAFSLRYGPTFLDRVILATGQFRVVPSLGQITQGHLLVVPVKHICSLCDLRNEDLLEMDNLRADVRSTLQEIYGACVFFEHGIRTQGSGGCGIDHAHMHAVPVTGDGVLKTLTQEFNGRSVQSLAEIKRSLDQDSSYLFFEDASSQRYVFPVNNLPSQYMRKLVAESIGKSNWDWRTYGHEPELISTMQRLSPFFSAVVTAQKG